MMPTYEIVQALGNSMVKRTNEDGRELWIPFDENNSDYQDYLAWLAEDNTPEPWNPDDAPM